MCEELIIGKLRRWKWLRLFNRTSYWVAVYAFWPINLMLAIIFRKKGRGVLHISAVTHQPYLMTRHLRALGYRADYLAKGPGWLFYKNEDSCDYRMDASVSLVLRYLLFHYVYEFWWAWKLYPQYQVIHSHFLQVISPSFWEARFLKIMGKKLVFHFRGDDIRRKELNMELNPDLNCCQECDYPDDYCHDKMRERLARLARKFGNLFLVTTPDLQDFIPEAIHFPFMIPELPGETIINPKINLKKERGIFKILHLTNHEGIDGTRYIVDAINRLRNEGYHIHLEMMKKVPFQEVLQKYPEFDLSVGKLMMGYYANAQIEAMLFGIPTMCYIRGEFLEQIPDCPIINVKPETVYEKIKYFLDHEDELEEAGRRGPGFVRKHHSGLLLARRLIELYTS